MTYIRKLSNDVLGLVMKLEAVPGTQLRGPFVDAVRFAVAETVLARRSEQRWFGRPCDNSGVILMVGLSAAGAGCC